MTKFIASVVTFNPDLDVLSKNLNALSRVSIPVCIVDNHSENAADIALLVLSLGFKFLGNQENFGVAKALNQALNYAAYVGADWLWTFDQDTEVAPDCAELVLAAPRNSGKADVVAYVVNHSDRSTGQPYDVPFRLDPQGNYSLMRVCITSGTLLNVRVAIALGAFDEGYFIDSVDHEFCLRARSRGYSVYRVDRALAWHSIGNISEHGIGFLKLRATNHTALRRYYMTRNTLLTLFKYGWVDLVFSFQAFATIFYGLFCVWMFESCAAKKTLAFLWGLRDASLCRKGVLREEDAIKLR